MTSKIKQTPGHHTYLTLRGGRMTKVAGRAASYAPSLGQTIGGMATTIATSAVLILGTSNAAFAGACFELGANTGVFSCAGAAAADDETQSFSDIPVDDLVVSTDPGFGLTTSSGDGISNVTERVQDFTFTDNNGSIISGADSGIYALNLGISEVSIIASGIVSGAANGVSATVLIGGVTLDVNEANGNTGIEAQVYGGSEGISITSGTANGVAHGIEAKNYGSGSTTITTTGIATGTNAGQTSGIGIYSYTAYGSGASSITTAGAFGGSDGIKARHYGSGDLTITATGPVTGQTRDGIAAATGFDAGRTNISATDVTGGADGIDVYHQGFGALAITTTGDVIGRNGNGLNVSTRYETGFSVSVNDVTGGDNGINVNALATASLSVTASGNVSGATGAGINVYAGDALGYFAPGLVDINAADVTGGTFGIFADINTSGSLEITTTGQVIGTASSGILARTGADTKSSTIQANTVTGGTNGVFAEHYGSEPLQITTDGDVIGGQTGILATTETASILITSNGAVTGQNSNGITATTTLATEGVKTDLTIVATDVTGAQYGIYAYSETEGDVSITASGTVTGTSYDGIFVANSSNGDNISVAANAVTGGQNGISISANGSGTTDVSATGDVIGQSQDGIRVSTTETAGAITLDVAAVSGAAGGIIVGHDGAGALSISASGLVTGETGRGINAVNTTAGTSIAVNAAAVQSAGTGIYVNNGGNGISSVVATDLIDGGADGIRIRTSLSGGDITVDVASVEGGADGIDIDNSGRGATSVTSTGSIIGAGENSSGIIADLGQGAEGTFNVNDVTGTVDGISVEKSGSGALSIVSSGTVTGQNRDGIYAEQRGSSTDLTITTVDVTGGQDGIDTYNYGSGQTSITATGVVTGTAGDGINALQGAYANSLSIAVNEVYGGEDGIRASHYGDGALEITATGDVTGLNGSGIYATLDQSGSLNGGNGTDIIIDVEGVTGGDYGIFADQNGSGELSITASGPIVANGLDGVRALNEQGTDTTINVGDVTAARAGVVAIHSGTGALRITSTGRITGARGIYADTSASATDLTISVNEVEATGIHAIQVLHSGSGAVVVEATGAVSAARDGIQVTNAGNGGTTVTASDVKGGIIVNNIGTGTTNVTVSGVISTSTGNAGVTANSGVGQQVFVTLQDGAVVENNEADFAIENDESDATITLEAGSRVESAILLNDGSDTLVLGGGAIDTPLVIDGGDDTSIADGFIDTILVTGSGVAINGGQFINFEALTIDGGSLSFSNDAFAIGDRAEGTGTRIINAGQLSLGSNFSLTGDVNIDSGSSLSAVGGGAHIVGNLESAGVLSTQNGTAGDVLTIDGDLSGDGTVQLDTALGDDASVTDVLAVLGDTSGNNILRIANAGGEGDITSLGIEVITVGGVSGAEFVLAGDFVTPGGQQAVIAGAFAYTLAQADDGDWALISQDNIVDDPDDGDEDPDDGDVDPDDGDVDPDDGDVDPDVGGDEDPDIGGDDDPDAGGGVAPDVGGGGDEPGPLFQPSAPIYETYAQHLLSLGGPSSVHDRFGANATVGARKAAFLNGAAAILDAPVWARIQGDRGVLVPSSSTTGVEQETQQTRIAAGVNFDLGAFADGNVMGGVNLSYEQSITDVTSRFGNGSIETDSFGVGVSATWFGKGGLYVDGQLNFDLHESDLTSDILGQLVSNNRGQGTTASIEVGQQFEVAPNLRFTPQAQLSHTRIDFDSFTGPNDERVSLTDGKTTQLRLGVVAEYALSNGSGSDALYGVFNLHKSRESFTEVDVSGIALSQAVDTWEAEIGLGGSYAINEQTRILGDVTYRADVKNPDENNSFSVGIGVQYQF